MNDKLLERFSVARKPEPHLVSAVAPQDESDTQDLGFFGVLRGRSERAVMIELRKRDGNIMAFAYAWLSRAELDASEGITLFAGEWEISISGRNLNREVRPNLRLFEAIAKHRVSWIREAAEGEAMQAPEKVTTIESVTWRLMRD